MTPFREDDAGPIETIRGLPQPLPRGESVLWQGSPNWLTFAVHALHVRFVLAWFALMTVWRVAASMASGAPVSEQVGLAMNAAILCAVALAILFALSWAIARSAIFTITEKRVVMRFGVAIRKYVNLPLSKVVSADVRSLGGTKGDIALTVKGPGKVGYIYLWPFVRPMKLAPCYPLLRSLPDATTAARILSEAAESTAIAVPADISETHVPAATPPAPTLTPAAQAV